MSYRARLTCLALLLLLSGCAVPATVRRESPAPPARDTFAAFPEAFRAKARSEERQGDLRTALLQWRVVRAFLPEDPEAAGRVTALEREIRSKADGHLRKGKEQYRGGMYEEARKEFLAALAYDPFLEEAADYLKRRLIRPGSLTYVTKEGDNPKSVAREIYNDPGKDFLVAYFSGLNAGAPLRPGTRLNLPLLDIPVAGAARASSRANRANAPVPSFAPPPAPSASPAPTRTPAGPAYADNPLETARASFRGGEYKKAAASAEQALAKSPASREARELRNAAYYQLGTEYLRRQEYPDSLRMFRKVDPSYKDQKEMVARTETRVREEAESRYAAGLKLFLAEDLEAAVREWEITLKLYPEHPTVKKDLEKARRLLERVRVNQ